jgi:hypothetical protein
MVLGGLGLGGLDFLLRPSVSSVLGVVAAWGQGLACVLWAARHTGMSE